VAVWVGNLSAAATEERLRKFFEERFGAAVMGVTMLPCAAGAPRAAIVDFKWISEGQALAQALDDSRERLRAGVLHLQPTWCTHCCCHEMHRALQPGLLGDGILAWQRLAMLSAHDLTLSLAQSTFPAVAITDSCA
jgi:hypothetical protein